MWYDHGHCYASLFARLLPPALALSCLLAIASPASADDLWVSPQKASQDKKVGNWAVANLGGETHFGISVPNNFATFTKSVVVLIPPATGVLSYALNISVGKAGDPHDLYSYTIGGLSAPVTANELTEIDVSSIFPAHMLTAGQTYVSLNFVLPLKNTTTQVVGLRFQYESDAAITINAGAGLVGGGTVEIGDSLTLALAAPVPIALGGTGSTVKNFVDLTSAQSISGDKQFTDGVSVSNLCIAGDCRTNWPTSVPDNLGNHVASQNLNMNGFSITHVRNMNVDNSLAVAGATSLGTTLSVGANASIANMLSVTGAASFANTIIVSGNALFGATMNVAGSVNAASFNTVSDERAKKDIEELSEQDMRAMLDRLSQARLVRFRFNDETSELDPARPEKHRPLPHVGVTAQSMPEEVVEHGELLRLNVSDMIGYLVATIRGLRAESLEMARRQEARIRQLEEQLTGLPRASVLSTSTLWLVDP